MAPIFNHVISVHLSEYKITKIIFLFLSYSLYLPLLLKIDTSTIISFSLSFLVGFLFIVFLDPISLFYFFSFVNFTFSSCNFSSTSALPYLLSTTRQFLSYIILSFHHNNYIFNT